MQIGINMHIRKPGHASLMTRGGRIRSFSLSLMHCGAGHPPLALKHTLLEPQCTVCNQNALKAQFRVPSSVCIVQVKGASVF